MTITAGAVLPSSHGGTRNRPDRPRPTVGELLGLVAALALVAGLLYAGWSHGRDPQLAAEYLAGYEAGTSDVAVHRWEDPCAKLAVARFGPSAAPRVGEAPAPARAFLFGCADRRAGSAMSDPYRIADRFED